MYSFESRVRFSEIDGNGLLSIPALVNYLQDCATFHSVAVGMWPQHVAQTGRTWLLSAWEIEIDRLPHFGEDIIVSTWATGFKGLRANRNLTICSADDEGREHPLVRADSSWFMFDMRTGKPIRIPTEEADPYRSDIERDAPLDMPSIPRSIRTSDEGTLTTPVTVAASLLDTNGHVNNAQYVSLALGALEESEAKDGVGEAAEDPLAHFMAMDDTRNPIHRLDVHYSRAAKLGDVICPHVHRGDDGSKTITLDDEAAKPYAIVRFTPRAEAR